MSDPEVQQANLAGVTYVDALWAGIRQRKVDNAFRPLAAVWTDLFGRAGLTWQAVQLAGNDDDSEQDEESLRFQVACWTPLSAKFRYRLSGQVRISHNSHGHLAFRPGSGCDDEALVRLSGNHHFVGTTVGYALAQSFKVVYQVRHNLATAYGRTGWLQTGQPPTAEAFWRGEAKN